MALTDAPNNGRPPAGEPRDWQGMAAEHEGQVTGLVGVLQAQLENEREALAAIEEVANGFRTREQRLTEALAALEGPRVGRPPASEARPSKRKTPMWKVRPGTLERVRVALEEIGREARISEIAQEAGVAGETARRAVDELRERDQVRITRRDRQLGAFYVLMPDTGGPRGA